MFVYVIDYTWLAIFDKNYIFTSIEMIAACVTLETSSRVSN